MEIGVIDNIFLRSHKTSKPKADLWFIHGFGESGLCFREAFSSKLADPFNLYVPDSPGFGVSPLSSQALTIEETTDLLENLIKKISVSQNIGIVAHSLGGLIGTWLCQRFGKQVIGFVNIEGNLTQADCFFSGKTKNFETSEAFYKFFTKEILKLISKNPGNETLERYYASVRFAHPEVLFTWGKSGVEATDVTKGGEEFLSLRCNKIYLWGDQSTPEETRNFIEAKKLPNKCFQGSGHAPMIDAADKCYQVIFDFFQET